MPIIMTVFKPHEHKHVGIARECHERLLFFSLRQANVVGQISLDILFIY